MADCRTVALDIGNTCFVLHPEEVLKRLHLTALPEGAEEWIFRYDIGSITTEEWSRQACTLLKREVPFPELEEAWNAMLSVPPPELTSCITACVQKNVRFIFFSDTNELHIAWIRRNVPFAHRISGSICSHETGCCKPDGKMYEAFEQKYGKPCLYLDDLEKNLAAASRLGWNARRVLSPADTVRILTETFLN